MIKVGDVISIFDYDYEEKEKNKKKWRVLEIYPAGVLCEHMKGLYKTFWNTAHLIENGYIPNFEDVYDEAQLPRNSAFYGKGNKLLDVYA